MSTTSAPVDDMAPVQESATAKARGQLLTTARLDTAQWWVLLSTAALVPLVYSRWTFDVFNITEATVLWVGVAFGSALQVMLRGSGLKLQVPTMWRYVVFYLAVLTLTTATSRAPAVSFLGMYGRLGGLITIFPTALLAWLLFSHMAARPRRRRQMIAAIACSSIVGALYLLAQQFDLETHAWLQFEGQEPTHPPGLLGNANFSGAHIAMGVGPMVWLATRRAGARRVLWLSGALIALVAVGVSQSRGAMMATVVALLVAAARTRLRGRNVALGALAAIAVVAIAAIATNAVGIGDITDAATADERLDLWEVAVDGSPDHLFLGGGPDLYLATFEAHAGPKLDGVVADEPHNVLLDHLDGSGLLGAGAWLALVAAAVVAARRTDRRDVVPWLAMGSAYLTQAMLSIDAVPIVVWGWVALAGVASFGPVSRRRRLPAGPRPLALVVGAGVLAVGLALAIQPFRADMAYRRGIEAANAGDTPAALAQFEQAIDRNGLEPLYHRRLGLALWGSAAPDGRAALEQARTVLLEALDLFPDDPSAKVWLAGVNDQLAAVDG